MDCDYHDRSHDTFHMLGIISVILPWILCSTTIWGIFPCRLPGKGKHLHYMNPGRFQIYAFKANQLLKNLIDLIGFSGYNANEIIYLFGMALHFRQMDKRRFMAVDISMDTEIKNAVNATGIDAQYDEKAKRLLGNKIILAHILVKTIDEFKEMDPKDVASYIEGEPFISLVPVEPGLTNAEKDGQRIVGLKYGECGNQRGDYSV